MSTTTETATPSEPSDVFTVRTETRVNFRTDKSALEVAAQKIENGAIVTDVEMEEFEDIAPENGFTYITTIATITVDRPTLPDRVEETLENEAAIRSAIII